MEARLIFSFDKDRVAHTTLEDGLSPINDWRVTNFVLNEEQGIAALIVVKPDRKGINIVEGLTAVAQLYGTVMDERATPKETEDAEG